MKISPDGTKIVYNDNGSTVVMGFNPLTGAIDPTVSCSYPINSYGVEFSEDGSVLYMSAFLAGGVYAADMSTLGGSCTNKSISGIATPYSLMRGPDGNIYLANQTGTLHAIQAGVAGNYATTTLTSNYITWGGTGCTTGFGVYRGLDYHAPQPCDTFTVTINPTDNPLVVCAPVSELLTVTNTDATLTYNYKWYQGGSEIGGATNLTYTATATDTFVVEVGTSNSVLPVCKKYDTVVIQIPTPNTLSDVELCSPSSFTLDVGNSTGTDTYQWYLDGVAIGSATSQTLTVNSAGVYSVDVTTSCGTNTVSSTVTLNASAVTVTNDTICVFSANADLFASGSGGPFEWYDDSLETTLLFTGTNYTPNVSGAVTYWVKDVSTS
jgi:hypothetical protein